MEVADETLLKSMQKSNSMSTVTKDSPDDSNNKLTLELSKRGKTDDITDSKATVDSDTAFDTLRQRFGYVDDANSDPYARDLISFDDNDEDDEVLLLGNQKEPSIDSCVDALDQISTSNSQSTVATQNLTQTQSIESSQDEPDSKSRPVSESTDFEVVTSKDVSSAVRTEQQSALQSLAQRSSPRLSRKLREGFRWQKQLVFRYKLTSHTAFERKDNKDPAPVTAIAVSK